MSETNIFVRWDGTRQNLSRRPKRGVDSNSIVNDRIYTVPTVADIADVGHLLEVFHDRKRWAGPMPGIDGLTWYDISRSQAAERFRSIGATILAGTYVPRPERRVSIPRRGTTPRERRMPNLFDRTVSSTLARSIGPLLEDRIGRWAFSYRPDLSHHDLLAWMAWMARLAMKDDRWVVGNFDIARAFPTVPIDGALEAHRFHGIDDPDLLRLIEAILRGARGSRHTVGLSKGCPYSPFAFELFIDMILPQESHEPFRLRFASNLVSLCRSVPEAQRERERYQSLLSPVGMALKEERDPTESLIADLKGGESTVLLGYVLKQVNGTMAFDLAESRWTSLTQLLRECHTDSNPNERAKTSIRAWIQAAGPSFETGDPAPVVSRIESIVRDLEYQEINAEWILQGIRSAQALWRMHLKNMLTSMSRYPLLPSE